MVLPPISPDKMLAMPTASVGAPPAREMMVLSSGAMRRAGIGDGGEVMAEQHVAVGGNVVEPVVELVGRRLARGVERKHVVCNKLAVTGVSDQIDADGGGHDPDGVDRFAALEGDVGEGKGTPGSDHSCCWLYSIWQEWSDLGVEEMREKTRRESGVDCRLGN